MARKTNTAPGSGHKKVPDTITLELTHDEAAALLAAASVCVIGQKLAPQHMAIVMGAICLNDADGFFGAIENMSTYANIMKSGTDFLPNLVMKITNKCAEHFES